MAPAPDGLPEPGVEALYAVGRKIYRAGRGAWAGLDGLPRVPWRRGSPVTGKLLGILEGSRSMAAVVPRRPRPGGCKGSRPSWRADRADGGSTIVEQRGGVVRAKEPGGQGVGVWSTATPRGWLAPVMKVRFTALPLRSARPTAQDCDPDRVEKASWLAQ